MVDRAGSRVRLRHAGTEVEAAASEGDLPLHVVLSARFHEDGPVPTLRGVVRRIRLVSIEYELQDRAFLPVPGTASLRDLPASPAGFDSGGDAPRHRSENALLVDVEPL